MPSIALTSTTRLYAVQLRLRPLQHGTLMPFSGELVHGAFLSWLSGAAPEVANWLHEGQKRRFFTCSSLQFNRPHTAMLRAERENIHLPLEPDEIYTVRLTLLLTEMLPLLHEALAPFDRTRRHLRQDQEPRMLRIGKQICRLEEIVLANDQAASSSGFVSLHDLVERASQLKCPRSAHMTLEFTSLTAFSRGHKNYGYGPSTIMLPLPEYVFPNLIKRWQDIAPPNLINLIQTELLVQYIQEEGVVIDDYELQSHHVHFARHVQSGFIGRCRYELRGPDQPPTPDTPLTLRQQLFLLADLAFFTGIGYKTTMGLGQARRV